VSKANAQRVESAFDLRIIQATVTLRRIMNEKDVQGAKKAPLRYVPPSMVVFAAPAFAEGARKYGQFDWRETPISYAAHLEAVERHYLALKDGEDLAPDSKIHHLAHLEAAVGVIIDAMLYGTLIDDRVPGPAGNLLEQVKQDNPTYQNMDNLRTVEKSRVPPPEDQLPLTRDAIRRCLDHDCPEHVWDDVNCNHEKCTRESLRRVKI